MPAAAAPPPPMLLIASRQSPLALRQAETVAAAARDCCRVAARIVGVSSRGDEIPDQPLAAFGGKELFVNALREAMRAGRANVAAHSLKDMAAAANPDFILAAIGFAEDPRDAAVVAGDKTLASLPPGATVGTSGPRRIALLRRHFPSLRPAPMRGNIHTRLQKLDNGACDAIILAAAGLKRMGLQNRIAEYLPPEKFIPAAGQGLIAVECLASRPDLARLLAPLANKKMTRRAEAERAFAAAMGGDCQTPLAAHAAVGDDGVVSLRTFFAAPDGECAEAETADADATAAGARAAAEILRRLRRRPS